MQSAGFVRAVGLGLALVVATACGPQREESEPVVGGWEQEPSAVDDAGSYGSGIGVGTETRRPVPEATDPSAVAPPEPAAVEEPEPPETPVEMPEAAASPAPEGIAPAPPEPQPAPALFAPEENAAPESRAPVESYRLAYEEHRPKSVLELQPYRRVSSVSFTNLQGQAGVASLVDLNPRIGAWFLLRLEWVGGGDPQVYHLENPFPGIQSVRPDLESNAGLTLARDGTTDVCTLWADAPSGVLDAAQRQGRPFAALCDGWLYLRNRTEGRRTSKEWAADFLRDRVWGGERITTLVRDTVFRDGYRKKAKVSGGAKGVAPAAAGSPTEPLLAPEAVGRGIRPSGLGLGIEREPDGTMEAGRWYPVRGVPGVTVGAVRPDMVAREVVERQGSRVSPLDDKESSSLVYMVAFDLSRLDLGFALGTEHPRVGWSERAPAAVRDDFLPGPDGIGTVAPLVRTGMLAPDEAVRVVATFTGGFKRSHGAFKSPGLGTIHAGSHYGFIEEGVILSKLRPGLSTLAVHADGRVTLGTWAPEMDAELESIRYARQNGVPILETDPATRQTAPGKLVKSWGDGNWSGSVDKKLRTLRAGACLQEGPHGRFLLYGYFSSATPSAMARVFEAYGCHDAMLLDMNALEHTYLACYRAEGERRVVEHLIDEMVVLDKVVNGDTVPRFVGFPDNRDFFFLLARPGS